jgi:hypothetical protein
MNYVFPDDIFNTIISYTISLREVQLKLGKWRDGLKEGLIYYHCEQNYKDAFILFLLFDFIEIKTSAIQNFEDFVGLKIRKDILSNLVSPIFYKNIFSYLRSDFDITHQWESDDFVYLKLKVIIKYPYPRIRFQLIKREVEDYHHFISSIWFCFIRKW